MPGSVDSGKTIVVMGDVTIDWNLARRAPLGIPWGAWHPDLKARASARLGGAALLAELVEASLAYPQGNEARPKVVHNGFELASVAPTEVHLSHSYAVWGPCDERRGSKRQVWRVDPPVGLDPPRTDDWVRDEWKRLGPELLRADVIALDDADLGFRLYSDSDLWRNVAAAERNPWILLKSSRPVADGQLFRDLRHHCAARVIALMTIDDLRGASVQVSRELSWERTAQDLYWEVVRNPLIKDLSLCAHVVVFFGAAGAVLLSRRPPGEREGQIRCWLLFDPEVMEGAWEAARPGAMIGSTACLATSLVSELSLGKQGPDLASAINSGVAGCRRLWMEGYGDPEEGMDIAFPVDAVVSELAGGCRPLECVEVQGQTPFRPRAVADGEKADVRAVVPAQRTTPSEPEALWTILEERYSGNLGAVAEDVAVRGVDKALSGVPFGRFGKLLTVDRGEIESFRSVRSLIAEYCRSFEAKPLSIAVFGAPGSGKSFGIVQVAQSVDPDRISDKIEFNLSQFNSLDDLHDALHQVRDVGLRGKIPLVFWDEFDARLGDTKLGWLRYFLAPMQDGEFRQGEVVHPIGRAIFVFAGGTSNRMQCFGQGKDREAFRDSKGPDFTSRLRGYVDILGPNRRDDRDRPYVIRRAILLRSILQRGHPQLFNKKDVLEIDKGVLRAFLQTNSYEHGARSLESIVATSRLSSEYSYQRSSLPSEAQLQMHVDGREFLSLVKGTAGKED